MQTQIPLCERTLRQCFCRFAKVLSERSPNTIIFICGQNHRFAASPPRCVYGGANSVDGVYHSGERTTREPEKVSYSNQSRCHIPPLRRHRPHLSLYTLKGQVMFRGKTSPSAIDTAPPRGAKTPLVPHSGFPVNHSFLREFTSSRMSSCDFLPDAIARRILATSRLNCVIGLL